MRLLTIGVLTLAVAGSACDRAETAGATNNQPATSDRAAAPTAFASPATPRARTATADPTATPNEAPVATAGRDETPRTAAVKWREIMIPAGTTLPIVLDTGVGSDISRVEEAVQAHLARAVSVHGETALPEGSRVSGVVTDARQSGKVKGLAHVAVRFDTLTPRGDDERYRIRTSAVGRTAPATKKDDALKIGAPAAGGALIGAIIGGKKGALIGTAAGGGAGTAVVISTRGKEVHMPKGAAFSIRLVEPLTVRVRG